jgi:hypothetical protein
MTGQNRRRGGEPCPPLTLNASSHCPQRPHALMSVLYVMTLGTTSSSFMNSNTFSASSHWPPFSQALLHHRVTHPRNFQGAFREHSGNVQGAFKERSVNAQGAFRERSGTFKERSGCCQGTFRERSGCTQGTFRERSVNMQ